MDKNLTPYEDFQMKQYGNVLRENKNPLGAEEFENGQMDQEKPIQEWHNEQSI